MDLDKQNGRNGSAENRQIPQHEQIIQALNAIHNPASANELRRDATQYLEGVQSMDEAPENGFIIASSKTANPIVRHYGLSLLDYAVRQRWSDYTAQQSGAVRGWILDLASSVNEDDPLYITNKIAELWVELAKRSWAVNWLDMDELLVKLWIGGLARKLLVLDILESLSEDIFVTEDPIAALRGNDLNRACVEIFVPTAVLDADFPSRTVSVKLRHGDEGWLGRMSDALDLLITENVWDKSHERFAVKTLLAFKSVVSWAVPNALISTRSVYRIGSCLAASNLNVQLAAIDALYCLYIRTRLSPDNLRELVGPMFTPDTISLLRRLYDWLLVDPTAIDDGKYMMLKRLSEMIYNLGRLLCERPNDLPEGSDLPGFIGLLLSVMLNESLQVSIPALHLWVRVLGTEQMAKLPAVQAVIADLLKVCSARLIRYEALPLTSQNASIMFLNEDIDHVPERHAFLGNYARFCNQIVELVVQQQPIDALYYILGEADKVLDHLYDGEPAFTPIIYTKNSAAWLKIDAQFTVIEAALKGLLRWLMAARDEVVLSREHEVMTSNLRVWCDRLLGLTFEDPKVKERVIQLASGFAIGPLKREPEFVVRVFDHILGIKYALSPQHIAYTDAIVDLQIFAIHQLQRIAMRFADHLATIFAVVERKIVAISQENHSDEQMKARYMSVLFIIMHRATNIDLATREARLLQYLEPFLLQWQAPALKQGLQSFESFSSLIGLSNVPQYLSSRQVHRIDEWSTQPLDQEGIAMQEQMQAATDRLPLRSTKHILSVSVEKVDADTEVFGLTQRLWGQCIPIILPALLLFVQQSQAFYNSDKWVNLDAGMSSVVRRIFTDRFWQNGISQGSRDEFYATIGETKTTMEGFASSIRASLRLIRETGYRMISCMSLLGETFYSLDDFASPLAQALYTDACALSPHQIAILIDTVRPVIENCPPRFRARFLPPIISGLFEQVDRKASDEWERIEHKKSAAAEDDDLTVEMKDESVLRHLTMAAVVLVAALLQPEAPTRSPPPPQSTNAPIRDPIATDDTQFQSMRSFILQSPGVLKSVILFCTHALRMHDTRACGVIIRALRSIVSEFAGESSLDADVREFISTEVLKACITSLNDSYFAEMQKDFAQLIGNIITCYSPRTNTPSQILCSLPGLVASKVEQAIAQLGKPHTSARQQRAIILDLLQNFRGVAITEQGKLPPPDPHKLRSVMQKRYMAPETAGMDNMQGEAEGPDLEGVAEMFK